MEQGYQDRPGSAVNELYKLLDSCIEWQQRLKNKSDNER
jgi:hypothetical protein